MSIVCTWKTSQMGDPSWCLRYAEMHLHHPHDLMHKKQWAGCCARWASAAVWTCYANFLQQHVYEMPRTTLRYAIEKMSEEERQAWMRRY